jgi:hypothetical protein
VLHPLSAAVADTALGGPRDASPETHSFTYLQDDGTDGEVASRMCVTGCVGLEGRVTP